MASKTYKRTICCLLMSCFVLNSVVHSFMDIEELQSINYGINIVKEPIVMPETHPDSAIVVTSRHGQQYQCNYPTHQEQKQQKEEEEKIALETGVVELLKPMSKGPCLLKTKDWWTYEVCYGKYVRQYHVEDGQIRGNIMYLGHFQSDFDWNNETLREARVRSKIASGRYHSQYYTNGSKCDLTGNGRQTEVRYLCEETEDDYVVRVDEPETCVYVITVHSPRICSHPHLKSPTPTQPIPIVCVPLLTDQQFLQYQAHTEALRLKEEEARARAKAELEQRERERAQAATQEEDDVIEEDLAGSVNSILKKSLGKEFKGAGSAAEDAVSDMESKLPTGWKVVKDLDDIGKLLDPQGILSNMDMSNKGQSAKASKTPAKEESAEDLDNSFDKVLKQLKKDEGDKAESDDSAEDDGSDPLDAAIDSEMSEFEREVRNLRDKQAMTEKRLQQIRERVKKAVTSQFKDIIEEAEAEIGGEVNEAVALGQLASSLNSLLEKLEHTEKEIKDMDNEISKLGGTEPSRAAAAEGEEEEEGEEKDRDEEEKEEEKVEEEGQGGLGEEEEGSKEGVQAPPSTKRATSAGRQTDEDSRWKMKVRKMSPEELENDASIQSLPSRQQKHLESSLKESLEKAGVDPNSVKVHVKIIGATTSDDEDDDTTLHVLSEEESASFQNMIVAILGGSNEAIKEQKRQKSLEDSYNFVFDRAISEDDPASSSAADSEDTDSDSETLSDAAPSLPEQGL